jgi:hypothetical protein
MWGSLCGCWGWTSEWGAFCCAFTSVTANSCIKLRRNGRILEQIYPVGYIANDPWVVSGRGTVSGGMLVQDEVSDVTPWVFGWQAI